MKRLMIVEDHHVVREGLRLIIEGHPDMKVCGEASAGPEAVGLASVLRPDIVLMDIRLGLGSGIEATREIKSRLPDTKVIMVSMYADENAILASVLAGASGYILKDIAPSGLVDAILRVSEGESMLDPRATEAVMERLRHNLDLSKDAKLSRLSPQEERILHMIAEGSTNNEIAASLGLAEKTVKNYVSAILAKLEVASRAAAAAYLVRHTAPFA